MRMLTVNNVNEALPIGVQMLIAYGIETPSRNGMTLEISGPVTTTYLYPQQRVLFSSERDANPFFHLMESLWILSGRRDVKWISEFNSKIHEYSDDGEVFHGAYGYRLRVQNGAQIHKIIKIFKEDPSTRRGVLQIWNARLDLNTDSKDIPCNDLIFFKIRDNKLNMTVCCRSNDIIWGAYGANVVHFSFIQEYIAGMVGVDVGVYNQISDSYHAYTERDDWKRMVHVSTDNLYDFDGVSITPLIDNPKYFDTELNNFMNEAYDGSLYNSKFFTKIAIPMRVAWRMHKQNKKGFTFLKNFSQTGEKINDWIYAGLQWLDKREGTNDK